MTSNCTTQLNEICLFCILTIFRFGWYYFYIVSVHQVLRTMAFLPMLLIEVYIKTLLRFYNLLIIITILPIPLAAYAGNSSRVEFEGNIVTDTCQSVVINEKLNVNCSIKNIEMSSSIDYPPSEERINSFRLKEKSGLIQSVTYKFLSKEKNIRLAEINYL